MVLEIPQSPVLRSLADRGGQLLLRDALVDLADLQAAQCLRSRQDGTVSNVRAAVPRRKCDMWCGRSAVPSEPVTRTSKNKPPALTVGDFCSPGRGRCRCLSPGRRRSSAAAV